MERVAPARAVVVFTGLPGTGKSTLADWLGQRTGWPVFAGDWLLGALKPAAPALATLDRNVRFDVYVGLLRSLVHRQLLLGQSAMVDGSLTQEVLLDWRDLAVEHGTRFLVVDCTCSDAGVHRSRVEGRVRGIPGWHEIDWPHVETMRALRPPLTMDRVVVDAVDPLAVNQRRILDALAEPSPTPGGPDPGDRATRGVVGL